MARSQKRSLSKQNENFDNLNCKNGPEAVFTQKILLIPCVTHTEVVFDACIIQTVIYTERSYGKMGQTAAGNKAEIKPASNSLFII